MKIYRSALTFISIIGSSLSIERATYNIPDRGSVERNHDSDLLDVLIKTSGRTGSFNAMSFSLQNINVSIEKSGIIGAKVTKEEMEELRSNPNVERVEVDQIAYALDDTAGHIRKLAEETPFGIPMVLEDMDFWKDLDIPSGSIKVCVADTGYDLGHEDLPSGSDVDGTDSPSNGAWDSDGNSHGTHCAGTVAGLGANSKGVVGVIPDNMGGKFQLIIGKALSNSGSGSFAGVLKAIDDCIDQGAKVISLSLGGGGYSATHDEFYKKYYEDEDILFVAAAGNGGNSAYGYPASYSSLMSVAAINSSKNKAGFSQYNDQVEISAPGVSTKSTVPNNKYGNKSGTSMATPHVAGVAGLLWMYFPECKNYQIRNALLASAEDLGDSGCDTKYGWGLVQAKAAYNLLSQGNCGGNLGKDYPVGGCEQAIPDGPTAAPTPECSKDAECDDGDACTVDTCDNGLCLSTPDCASCGKTKVDVEITIDNYGGETAYDIKDASDSTIMQGSGWPANSVNSFWKCFSSGTYKFKITDGYGDGLCCSYGNGGYVVEVDDDEVVSGGQFGSEETKTFEVGSPTPTTPSPSTSAPVPAPTAPVSPPTPGTPYPTHTAPTPYPTHITPTMYPTAAADPVPTPYPTDIPPTLYPTEATCKVKGAPCTKHDQCCGKKCNLKKNKCRK